MRVAVGAVAKRLLAELDIEIANHVVIFGGKGIQCSGNLTVSEIKKLATQSEVSIVNQEREQEIKDYIDQIKRDGDTIGGVVETVVGGVPGWSGFLCSMGSQTRCKTSSSGCLNQCL